MSNESVQKTEALAAIVLAAGQGTRMRSANTHKVCFPVAGLPAINRMVGLLRDEGCTSIVVVVGALAGDVVRTVGESFPESLFVLQKEQRGTGDAARVGFAPLQSLGFAGQVLVTMGDKVVAPGIFQSLKDEFHRGKCDAVFAVSRKDTADQGRVAVGPDGQVRWLLESADIDRARLFERLGRALEGRKTIASSELRRMAEEVVPRESRRHKILGPLAALITGEAHLKCEELLKAMPAGAATIATPSGDVTGDEALRDGRYVNESLYLLKFEALAEGLANLTSRTAQGEEYLPDVVSYLLRARDREGRARFKVRAMIVDHPNDILGFNTPDQLVAVEAVVAARESQSDLGPRAPRTVPEAPLDRRLFKPVGQWLKIFTDGGPRLTRALKEIYGDDAELLERRRAAALRVLKLFARKWGPERRAIMVRAPGRVNLMGRHVEHRGGHTNYMVVGREVLMVVGPRDDDVVQLTNVDRASFPDRQFRISEELAAVPWDDWLSYINSRRVQQMVLDAKGDWSNYVKAACLRLQQGFHAVRLRGMDAAVIGDIPLAAGLSSSSAIVVAAGEATIACNRLNVEASEFVDLCGEGEWYVGSRGGAGDHAAMKLGRRGQVARVQFFPFRAEHVPGVPDDYRLVVFNSQIKAQKSAGARDVFNQKVAAYEFGLMMVMDRYPHFAHLIEHLRDLNAERLHVRPHVIYEILLGLPPSMTREALRQSLSATRRERAEKIFQSHQEPTSYDIRSVVLFGLAECARSERFAGLLKAGQFEEAGRMMFVSHDGDRVARWAGDGPRDGHLRLAAHDWQVPDARLRQLVSDLQSEDPVRVEAAQLYNQPGGYACSVPEIDLMVDLARSVDGVLGAQLSGAGLGGCMMVLVRTAAVERLERKMVKEFYKPRRLKPDATICQPVEGSGLLAI